ncbi:MAG: N-formylglutamate amidohydrolase [Pikeienuella sp.]
MSVTPPYQLIEPATLSSGAVFSSPHSGRAYPPELIARTRLHLRRLRASEDALVDRLFGAAPRFGAPLLCATAPRAFVDLNRAPSDLDPALIDGVPDLGINQRVAAGLGVVPRVVSEGEAIYAERLSLAEAQARLDRLHTPYHACLSELIARAKRHFGIALVFDCHSMPTEALRAAPRVNGRLPDVVLGDRFGASAGRSVLARTQEAFEAAGLRVVRNTPFAGGYITQTYGCPQDGVHVVQIEIDRGLYLDQVRIEPTASFSGLQRLLGQVVAQLCGLAGESLPHAAE